MKHNRMLSIVIATLGEKSLCNTLECISQSTLIPLEVILCIPMRESYKLERYKFPDLNVRVINLNRCGQVYQRSEGLKACKGGIVLQMDDDVEFAPNVLNIMFTKLLALGPGHAIGPVFCDLCTDIPFNDVAIPKHGTFSSLFVSMYLCLVGGLPWGVRQYGAYSNRCFVQGVRSDRMSDEVFQVSWLAGGFVMSHREDLVLHDFYPFEGKAFYEDILHARAREGINVKHSILRDVRVRTGLSSLDNPTVIRVMSNLINVTYRRWLIGSILGCSRFILFFSLGVDFIVSILKSIKRRLVSLFSRP